MTQSGLIAYLKVSRNAGFKYLVCCCLPMVEVLCTKFSHVLHQFLTFQSIHCANSHQLSFPLFQIVFEPRLTVSGKLQKRREVGAKKEGKRLFKIEKEGVGMN